MKTDVYLFRGTGEAKGGGMCHFAANKLDRNKYNIIEIQYPATIGPIGGQLNGVSLNKSLVTAQQLFLDQIRSRPNNPVAIIGYSLGALAASRILENYAWFQNVGRVPVWAILIANPARNPGDSALNMCDNKTYGIHGTHKPYPRGTHVIELANGHDMITASHDNSPIRLISYLASPFEVIAQKQSEQKSYDLIGLLNRVRQEDWLSWIRRGNYNQAARDLTGYLIPFGLPPRTQHTLYHALEMPGTGKTWTDWAVSEVTHRFG